jgi:hypothetical protein
MSIPEKNDNARTPGQKALADWREAVAKEVAALEASNEACTDAALQAAYRAAMEHSRAVAQEAWTWLQEPDDVLVRAEIVRHCLWPQHQGNRCRRFDAVLDGEEYDDGLELDSFDERAAAELVKAVLWTAPGGTRAMPDASRIDKLTGDLDEMLCKVRQGVTALRTVVKGWERAHGPQKLIDEDDAAFLASLDFCADGIETTIELIADRVDDEIEGRRPPG